MSTRRPSSMEPNPEYRKQVIQSTLAVSFYMVVSIGLVFLNRICLSSEEKAGGLFVSWYQFVVAYVIIVIISFFCQSVPLLNLFPPLHYQPALILKVLPVSISYLMMIGFNNKCLEYVSVSAYQIVRSLTILFNIILSFFVLHQKTSLKAMLACGGVIVGFFFGVTGELGLSFRGAVYGVLSSFFVALYSIVVKRVMSSMRDNEYLLIEYNTPIAIILLTPFVWWSGEFSVFSEAKSTKFWTLQTFAGVTGFIINIAIFLNIKYTTPLTHNLSGTVKACLQTLIAFYLFPGSEILSGGKLLGTGLIIGFSAYYAHVRKSEMKASLQKLGESDPTEGDIGAFPDEKVELFETHSNSESGSKDDNEEPLPTAENEV